ncbi:MAG TPA: glycosyltransferase family 2 protein [Solirubrobacterales bacterium]|nr:glycosyltransferase family 2 protein [Solirubrobacterales bacterium]
MKLSVVIPAHNEAGSIAACVTSTTEALSREGIDYEILVIDDASVDGTSAVVDHLAESDPRIQSHRSHYSRGFGLAVRAGLDRFQGDAVAIMMADGSDDPADLIQYHRVLEDGFDCALGSRFVGGRGRVSEYPWFKLILNRLVNWWIRALFRHGYDDTTNAFKAYKREVIDTVQPLLANHFNLTVEIPLKAIVRGHSYGIVPITWRGRSSGTSKLDLREMGSRYVFIVLYVLLERYMSRGDYMRPGLDPGSGGSGARSRPTLRRRRGAHSRRP